MAFQLYLERPQWHSSLFFSQTSSHFCYFHTNSVCLSVCLSSVIFVHPDVGFQFSSDVFSPSYRFAMWWIAYKTLQGVSHPTKFGQLIQRKIFKTVANWCQILRLKCTKVDFYPLPLRKFTVLSQTLWLQNHTCLKLICDVIKHYKLGIYNTAWSAKFFYVDIACFRIELANDSSTVIYML